MGRRIKVNMSPSQFKDLQGKNIQIQVKTETPQYLTPRARAHLV